MEDWDLQAVVRGCYNSTTTTTTTRAVPFTSAPLGSCLKQEDQFLSLPDLYQSSKSVLHEFEQLYKPFSPHSHKLITSPKTLSTSTRVSPVLSGGLQFQQKQLQNSQQKQIQQVKSHRPLTGSIISPATTTTQSQISRPKKRKNQQKRVVCQVPAEGLSSDMWAWRKYGQKPIKGSPYPRGYYRCSSSKGCLARKQVEKSRSDPSMFIITYTSEHNHPVPTHRNSLAGSTRHKFSTSLKDTTINGGDEEEISTNKPTCSSSSSQKSTTDLSPTTPLMTSMMNDEIKQDNQEDDEQMIDEEDEENCVIPHDLVMDDDFFMGLEEFTVHATPSPNAPEINVSVTADSVLDDSFTDQFPANFPTSWYTNNATTAIGGS